MPVVSRDAGRYQRGGGGVNMEEYARRMASSRCDGDHITLQALCDALKVNINVVKWTRDNGWYPRSAAAVLGVPLRGAGNGNNKGSDAPAVVREVGGRRPRRSVFVADTLRPRALPSLDDRAGALRLQGRTLWLSLHGEAHFRSLRVREPATEEEVCLCVCLVVRFVRLLFSTRNHRTRFAPAVRWHCLHDAALVVGLEQRASVISSCRAVNLTQNGTGAQCTSETTAPRAKTKRLLQCSYGLYVPSIASFLPARPLSTPPPLP